MIMNINKSLKPVTGYFCQLSRNGSTCFINSFALSGKLASFCFAILCSFGFLNLADAREAATNIPLFNGEHVANLIKLNEGGTEFQFHQMLGTRYEQSTDSLNRSPENVSYASQSSGPVPSQDVYWKPKFDKNMFEAAGTQTGNEVGESIDLFSGDISFYQTDYSIPGNSAIPVKVARYKHGLYADIADRSRAFSFHDWELDVPTVYRRYTDRAVANTTTAHSRRGTVTDHCSAWYDDQENVIYNDTVVDPFLIIDGQKKSLLRHNSDDVNSPYPNESDYITKDNWIVECTRLPFAKNTANNEYVYMDGLKVKSPDGLVYTFNHILHRRFEVYYFDAKDQIHKFEYDNEFVYRVSRIEDQHGNYVNYRYSLRAEDPDNPDQELITYINPAQISSNDSERVIPIEVTHITASDGRQITFEFDTEEYYGRQVAGFTATADMSETDAEGSTKERIHFTYSYNTDTHTHNTSTEDPYNYDHTHLDKVVFPNNEEMTFDFTGAVKSWDSAYHYRNGETDMPNYRGMRFHRFDWGKEFKYQINTRNGSVNTFQQKAYFAIDGFLLDYQLLWENAESIIDDFGSFDTLKVLGVIESKQTTHKSGETYTWNYSYNTDSFIKSDSFAPVATKKILEVDGPDSFTKYYFPLADRYQSYGQKYVESLAALVTAYWEADVPPEFGQIEKIEHYSADGATLLRSQDIEYESAQVPGRTCGDLVWCNHWNQKHQDRLVTRKKETITDNTNEYVFEVMEFNDFNIPLKVKESNDTSDNTDDRYTKFTYHDETSHWIINLPESTSYALTDTEDDYFTVNFIEYHNATTDANYDDLGLPYQMSVNGIWVKRFPQYDNGLLVLELYNSPLSQENGISEENSETDDEYRYTYLNNYKNGIPELITLPLRGRSATNHSGTGTTSMSQVVDHLGRIISVTDFRGTETHYTYDDIGRLLSIDLQNDSVYGDWTDLLYSWSHDSSGYPVRTVTHCQLRPNRTQCLDNTTHRTITESYDYLLRLLNTKQDFGDETRYQYFEYNSANKISFESFVTNEINESKGRTTTYDGLYRAEKVNVSGLGETSYDYLEDNKVEVTDPETNKTTYSYYALSNPDKTQLVKIESEENVTTEIDVNVFGLVEKIRQTGKKKDGQLKTFEEEFKYNANNQLCLVIRPDVGSTAYSLNAIGEVNWAAQGVSNSTCISSKPAVAVDYEYDNVGALASINYNDSNSGNVSYERDNNGNLTSLIAGDIEHSYIYNNQNLLELETLVIKSGDVVEKTMVLDYEFHATQARSAMTYPDGTKVQFKPNGFGEPTEARSYIDNAVDLNFAHTVEFYANGMLESFTYGNGAMYSATRNSTSLLPDVLSHTLTGSEIVDLTYSFDGNANVSSIINGVNPDYSLDNIDYDGLNRLTNTYKNNSAGEGEIVSSVSYDGFGNITAYDTPNSELDYHYDYEMNRLTSVSGTGSQAKSYSTFSYDSRGNVENNSHHTLNFNRANQLYSTGSGNSYSYDGHSRRVKQIDSNGTRYSMYSFDGQLVYSDVRANSQIQEVIYIYIGGRLVAKYGELPPANNNVQNYRPYGDTYGDVKIDDVGFTGHKYDADISLNYMQARYYDPVIGRFYSNDPVGFTGEVDTFNRYSYVANNPYKYTDPDGESKRNQMRGAATGYAIASAAEKYFDKGTPEHAFAVRMKGIYADQMSGGKKGGHGNKKGNQPAEQYALKDRDTGDVKKYGETTRGEDKFGSGNQKRYSKKELKENNVDYVKEASGPKKEMHELQTQKIKQHTQEHGQRPPLNKTDY